MQMILVSIITTTKQLTTNCNFSSRKSSALFWTLEVRGMYMVDIHTCRQDTYAHQIKINKILKQIKSRALEKHSQNQLLTTICTCIYMHKNTQHKCACKYSTHTYTQENFYFYYHIIFFNF